MKPVLVKRNNKTGITYSVKKVNTSRKVLDKFNIDTEGIIFTILMYDDGSIDYENTIKSSGDVNRVHLRHCDYIEHMYFDSAEQYNFYEDSNKHVYCYATVYTDGREPDLKSKLDEIKKVVDIICKENSNTKVEIVDNRSLKGGEYKYVSYPSRKIIFAQDINNSSIKDSITFNEDGSLDIHIPTNYDTSYFKKYYHFDKCAYVRFYSKIDIKHIFIGSDTSNYALLSVDKAVVNYDKYVTNLGEIIQEIEKRYPNTIIKKEISNTYARGEGYYRKVEYNRLIARSTGCYVATCVYGSYDCPEVWRLRRYRDNYLDNHWWGRLFIKVYYTISPKLVKLFGNKNWFRNPIKRVLDRKIFKLEKEGYLDTPYNDKY